MLGVWAQPAPEPVLANTLQSFGGTNPLRFCQKRPWLSLGHSAAATVKTWKGFSMEGHRCSGWVYSSLFHVIMRI